MLPLLFGLSIFATSALPDKPNIVYIMADDLGYTDPACYGSKYYETPNIDNLASQGMRFLQGYSCGPNCQPTRAALMSGQYGPRTGIYTVGNIDRFDWQSRPLKPVENVVELPLKKITLADSLKSNGYKTALFGKWHLGQQGEHHPSKRGFDEAIVSMGKHYDFVTIPKVAYPQGTYLADFLTNKAVNFINQNKEKPFFLAVGLYRPHTPYVAPKKYFELYPIDKITIPVVDPNHKKGVPAAAFLSFKKDEEQLTDDLRKKATQAYLASISFMDAQVGRIINELDRLKLGDDTLIIFTSDHGYHMGEHGLWQKRSIFEESARVPLIMVAPKSKTTNVSSPRTVEMLDIYPTVADLCGLKQPDYLDGKSLIPLLEDPKAQWNRPAITQTVLGKNINGYTIRSERYRYTEWNKGKDGVQLYDHDADPKELKNLANDPAHQGTVSELSKLMSQRLSK